MSFVNFTIMLQMLLKGRFLQPGLVVLMLQVPQVQGLQWFHGFRNLATNGVDKPVLNVFRMFGMMKGRRVEAFSDRGFSFTHVIDSGVNNARPDIGAFAARDNKEATVMIWNYYDDDLPATSEIIKLEIKSIPASKVKVSEYRIDNGLSNSYEVWKNMGSPQNPDPEQIRKLEEAGKLHFRVKPGKMKVSKDRLSIPVKLPRQAVSLFKIEWK